MPPHFDNAGFSVIDKRNLVHLKDMPMVLELKKVVGSLVRARGEKVVLMSSQMGMIPFYIAKEFYGDVMIMDMMGLADNTFTKCDITNDLRKTMTGLSLSYSFYFPEKDRLHSKCGVPVPDIIYDLDRKKMKRQKFIENNGYTIIFSQIGEVKANFNPDLKANIGDNQFIAVRDELMPLLDNRTFKWDWRVMKLLENTI